MFCLLKNIFKSISHVLVQFYFWYSSSWFMIIWQVSKIVKKSVFWVFRRFSFVYQGTRCLLELPWQPTQTGWIRQKHFIFTLSRCWKVLDQSSTSFAFDEGFIPDLVILCTHSYNLPCDMVLCRGWQHSSIVSLKGHYLHNAIPLLYPHKPIYLSKSQPPNIIALRVKTSRYEF